MNASPLRLAVVSSLAKVATTEAAATSLDLLVQVQAPEALLAPARPKLNLSLAIDVSGSMSGHPLECVRLAAAGLIDMLQDQDRVSLVTYSSTAQVLVTSAPASAAHKELIKSHLSKLVANGSTALHAGWLTAAQTIAPHVSDYGISRVLLLSDGQANIGVVDVKQMAEEAQKLMVAGMGTSTFGVGVHFDENLMTSIAKGGQACYAQDADQMSSYFVQELSLMSRVVAKSLLLDLQISNEKGRVEYELLNDLCINDQGIHLPSVISGGQSWCVVRVKDVHAAQSLRVNARVSYMNSESASSSVEKQIEIGSAKTAKVAKNTAEVKELSERVKELEAVRLQKEALEEAQRGRWENFNHLVNNMSMLSAGNAYVAGVAQNLSAISATRDINRLSKEIVYASHTMGTRAVLLNEDVSQENDELGLRKAQQGLASGKKE